MQHSCSAILMCPLMINVAAAVTNLCGCDNVIEAYNWQIMFVGHLEEEIVCDLRHTRAVGLNQYGRK